MSRYLFLFTISPVQAFIEAARKTQDLYAGSRILSHFCRVVMDRAEKNHQAEIIFPSKKIRSLPNRVLALLEAEDDPEHLRGIGRDLEQAVRRELADMAETITKQLQIRLHDDLTGQLERYFQIHWIFHPLKDDASYAETYRQIEAALESIKNVRVFGQLIEEGRKCSITGEHNVLYYRPDGETKRKIPLAIQVPETVPFKYFAPGEALGGVAFVKRCADRFFKDEFNNRFPSTSRIAMMDALDRLSKKEKAFENILDADFDEQDVYRKKNGAASVEDEYAAKIYKHLDKHRIEFTPYYAVLVFDGDSMGEWLSGARLKREIRNEAGILRQFHNRLSEELGNFAKQAEEQIVKPPVGVTVYAGGDDFLGFVNLASLFRVMKALRERFDESIDLTEFADRNLTFSAGVAIAHYSTPLAEVLSWARRMMDEEAKNPNIGKNAFGIALLRRSGEISKSVYKWKLDDRWSLDLLDKVVGILRNDLSPAFIRTFHMEFRPLMEPDGRLNPGLDPDKMVRSELKRLIERTEWKKNLKAEERNRKVEELLETLMLLYEHSDRFEDFLSLLDLAAFMEREVPSGASA